MVKYITDSEITTTNITKFQSILKTVKQWFGSISPVSAEHSVRE